MSNEHPALKTTRRLSWLLDNCFRLPGGFRIGLDGLIGLIPGVGDAFGALFGLGILASAIRHKAPFGTLIKITFNLLIDLTLGAVPIIGDLFDFFFKSNARSLKLLEDHFENAWQAEQNTEQNKPPLSHLK